MNIKIHTPKSLKMGSGMANLKQFIMSIVATSISIILTFGTAYFVDKNKKENEKIEIAKMIIFDMDQTIKKIERNDSTFYNVCRLQLQVPAARVFRQFAEPITWHCGYRHNEILGDY